MTALSGWLNKHAPSWIVKEGDPHSTTVRMVLVVLSLAPAVGLAVFVVIAGILTPASF